MYHLNMTIILNNPKSTHDSSKLVKSGVVKVKDASRNVLGTPVVNIARVRTKRQNIFDIQEAVNGWERHF